jgi:serine/threonine protein kinase
LPGAATATAAAESPDCFDEQTVLDLVAGRLSEASLVRVERHLGSCEICTDLVAVSAPLLNGQRVTATLQFGGGPDDKQTVVLEEEDSPRRRHAALAAGTVLRDTYEIVRRIGQGGMGDVYEAKHARLTGRYAVKVLPPEFALNEAVLSRFHREAQIASGLQHPNIVQVIDFHETDDGTPYLVMEFLDGEDLSVWMTRRGPIPLAEAMPLVEQIGAALTAVHRRGIVHRDVKPQNVFLIPQENGRTLIKLVDFGLSKAHAPSLIVTRQPMLLGTPQYMAPEQALARGDEVGPATDQFALGAIIYQMLSGRPPFVGERISSVLYQIVHEDPPPLGAGVDGRVEAALRKALSKRPPDRFASMAAFVDALREAMVAGALLPMPGIAESITRSITIPVDKGRRRRSLAILGGTAFLVTLGVLFALRPGMGSAPARPLAPKADVPVAASAAAAATPAPTLTSAPAAVPATTPLRPPIVTAAASAPRSRGSGAHPGHARPAARPATPFVPEASPSPPTSPSAPPVAGTPRLVEDL